MGFSLKKLLIGGVTAAAIAGTVVTTSISASDANKITITPVKSTVAPGETFDVMVGYEPGSDGVAAFTIDLHYDSSKLEVYTPTADELEGKYNVGTKFSYVSFNYTYSESVVRITGYSVNNVKTSSNLALVTFKAKSTAKDTAGFWIDVDTMTSVDGDGSLKDASYSVPTKTSMVKLTIKTPVVTTTKPTTAAPSASTTVTTTTKTGSDASANQPVTTTQNPVTTTPPTTTSEPVVTTPQTSVTTLPPVNGSEPVDTENGDITTSSPDSEAVPPLVPVFEYTYNGEGEFEENSESNYRFNFGAYVEDFSKSYDITLLVSSTGSVNGAIGFNDESGSWTTENFKFAEEGTAEWTVTDVKLDPNDADVYVPIYYMAHGVTFTINSVKISDSETHETIVGDIVTDDKDQPEDDIITDESELPVDTFEEEIIPDDDKDEAPGGDGDENPDTADGLPVWVMIAIPLCMAAGAVISVVRLKRSMK